MIVCLATLILSQGVPPPHCGRARCDHDAAPNKFPSTCLRIAAPRGLAAHEADPRGQEPPPTVDGRRQAFGGKGSQAPHSCGRRFPQPQRSRAGRAGRGQSPAPEWTRRPRGRREMTKRRDVGSVDEEVLACINAHAPNDIHEATGKTAGLFRKVSDPDSSHQLHFIDAVRLAALDMRHGREPRLLICMERLARARRGSGRRGAVQRRSRPAGASRRRRVGPGAQRYPGYGRRRPPPRRGIAHRQAPDRRRAAHVRTHPTSVRPRPGGAPAAALGGGGVMEEPTKVDLRGSPSPFGEANLNMAERSLIWETAARLHPLDAGVGTFADTVAALASIYSAFRDGK